MCLKRHILYSIILLPGVKDPLYQSTLLEELRVQQNIDEDEGYENPMRDQLLQFSGYRAA